jgi:hypothetical protein
MLYQRPLRTFGSFALEKQRTIAVSHRATKDASFTAW